MGSFSENYDRIGSSAGTFNSLPASAFKAFDEQLKVSSYVEPSLNKSTDNIDNSIATRSQRSLGPSPIKKKPRMIVPAIAIVHQKQLPVPIRRDTTVSVPGSFDDRQSFSASSTTEMISPAATSPDLRNFSPQPTLEPNPAIAVEKPTNVARKLSFASSLGDASDAGSEGSEGSLPSRQDSAGSIPPITLVEPKSLLSTQLQAIKDNVATNTDVQPQSNIPRMDNGNDVDLDQIT